MHISRFFKHIEKILVDNSPLILTGIGVAGTITTAVLTGKAAFESAYILRDEEDLRTRSGAQAVDVREKIELVWKLYIPAVGVGATTIACIVGSNRIGTRRAAALAAAYSVSEKAFVEYKEKVIEKIGESKEQKVRDEIAQDRVNAKPVETSKVIVTGTGDVLCYEAFTDRYFESSMDKIEKAVNKINSQLNNDQYASLSDFYRLLKLPLTSQSEEVGWNADNLLEMNYSTTIAADGRPCISIDYNVIPSRDYFRIY